MAGGRTQQQIKKGNRTPEGVRVNNYESTGSNLQAALMEQMTHGLQLTAKHPGGRPRKYEDINELKQAISNYFTFISEKGAEGVELIPDVEGLCSYIGICRDTLNEWQQNRGGEFSDLIKEVKNAIAAYKKQLGLQGKIPPIILAMDFNNNHGYTQQQTIDITASRKYDNLPNKEEIIKRIAENDPADVDG